MWVFSNIYCPLKLKYGYKNYVFLFQSILCLATFLRYTIIPQCTRILNVHMFQMRAQIHFAEFSRGVTAAKHTECAQYAQFSLSGV